MASNDPRLSKAPSSIAAVGASSSTARNLRHAGGFFACMVAMELALEGAMKEFPDLESLPHAVTLFQFGSCFALPVLLTRGRSLSTFPRKPREALPYALLSLAVFGSTFLASLSARHVSYPTKVVFKSAKLVPTMIVATVLQPDRKRYSALDYTAACLLCAGAAGYGFGGGGSGGASEKGIASFGILCLLVSIFCDAFTPNLQQQLMDPPPKGLPVTDGCEHGEKGIKRSKISSAKAWLASLFSPSTGKTAGLSVQELMTNANGVGCAVLVAWMALTGALFEALQTTMVFPRLLVYLCVIGSTLSLGVFCYTQLIRESGPVVAVAVATLRKVATIVLSYVIYPKRITIIHVLSGLLVLGGILLSNYSRQRSSDATK